MFGLSITHILLLLLVVLILFGRNGKVSQIMGDLGKGVRNFKAGLSEDPNHVEKTEKNDTHLPPPTA
jgi:sec-independent protein translocase protein TatA